MPADSIHPQDHASFPIRVFLVDDQAIIGEAIREMFAGEPDIHFQHCTDPSKALREITLYQPTVILQDLVMPNVNGLMMVRYYRASDALRNIPLVVLSSREDTLVKAQAFAMGANDYLIKLPDKMEMLARIRYHSASYNRLLERDQAFAALARSQHLLAQEIHAGAKYLSSLLPLPCNGTIKADWLYQPCSALGGDTFGYSWIDENSFCAYMIDVTGHGMASALLAVSIMNVLRSRSLAKTDFKNPAQVLEGLNKAFPSEDCGEKFFTIWYGVYTKDNNTLAWAGGGHPPPLLFQPGRNSPIPLETNNPLLGLPPFQEFTSNSCQVPSGSKLYIYTDGCFEIHRPNGKDWQFSEFVNYIGDLQSRQGFIPEILYSHVLQLNGTGTLDDDFSILELIFQ